MTVHHVIGVRLRQPLSEHIEALARIARARNHELALARDALLVLDLGDEPGASGHCTRHCTSCAMGSWVSSGGAYSARMPSPRWPQVAPPSSVNQIPPVETAMNKRRELRGSTQIEWMPGRSAPPPIHCRRLGWSQSERIICQLWP